MDLLPHRVMKRGKITRTPGGAYLLVNEKGHSFKAGGSVVAIWTACKGDRTVEEICGELAAMSQQPVEEIRPRVTATIARLQRHRLIKVVN